MQTPKFDETKMPTVMKIIDRLAIIFDEEDFENDDDIKNEISELESQLLELIGKNIQQCQPFQNYWAYTDLETVAKKILLEKPKKENLSDEQLYEIFENILEVRQDEAETDYLLEVLKVETGIDDIENYIYYPDEVGLEMDASEDVIFKKILSDRYVT